jgi:hypothetical protein
MVELSNLLVSYSKTLISNSLSRPKNIIGMLLTQNKNTNPKKFNKCGVCQLTCQYLNRKYIGQTGWNI